MAKRRKSTRNNDRLKIPVIEVNDLEPSSDTSDTNYSLSTMYDSDEDLKLNPDPEMKALELFPDRTKEIFYDLSADTSICLSDQKIIKINKAMLYLHAKGNAIFRLLYSPLKNKAIEITDFDSITFKLFLDCIMGFIPYTFENALIVFPVVWKYKIERSIQDCIDVLVFKDMNETVCNCLNMAVSLKCEALVNKVIDFIYNGYNPYRFLENETYCFLLEPESLLEVIKKIVYLDSFTVNVVMNWGRNYLEKNPKYKSVKALFETFKIKEYLKKSLQKFGAPKVYPHAADSFLSKVISRRKIVSILVKSKKYDCRSSKWKNITQGDTVTEEVRINLIKCGKPVNLLYKVATNFVIYYDLPNESDRGEILLSADLSVQGQTAQRFSWECRNGDERRDRPNRYLEHYATGDFCVKGNNLCNNKVTLKIKYKFMRDCRILLMTQCNDFSNLKKLYFTKTITLSGIS